MTDLKTTLDSILAWLLLPTTLFGAGGAAIRALRQGKCAKQVLAETIGGVVVSNMLGPVIAKNMPEHWHYTLFFLAGFGGLELVGRIYEAIASGLEQRARNKAAGED